MPEVSIIIPAYNAGLYIERTLDSIQSQSLNDFEVIIVNDGSTDNTIEKISPYLEDKRIRLINQINSGVCSARNTGIEHAKGRYLTFLDADDEMLPENLKEKVAILEKNLDYDWVFSNLNLIDENNKLLKESTTGTNENIVENILLWEGDVVPCPCSNILAHKRVFDNGLRFDTELSTAGDQDFCIYIANSYKGYFIKKPLASYRILPNSMSRNIAVMELDHIKVYRKAERNKLFKSKSFKRKCFSNLYLILAGSWYVNGGKKGRSMYFICKSLITYPSTIKKLIRKLI